MIGKIINERYEIVDKLGGGGMSNVYLAEDTILQIKVAIKAISIPPREKEETLKRFEREVYNSSQLSHDNIVSMIDVDEEEDCYFLVMEYIEGPTLAEYIQNHGPLNVTTAIDFTTQILNGIKHAHDCRIVHRDIKPQNILIDPSKTLKIFDFGIAKALSETSLTQTKHVLGTVQYFSPEQAKGESTDESTDIYSIGIVLYEMLVGEPPFNGETAVSIAIKHIQDSVPNITTTVRPDIPQALSNVILRATEKDKANRYKSIQEMKDDLSSVLHDKRADEKVYELDSTQTKAVPVASIKEAEKKPTHTTQTMQVPIVKERKSHQQFQTTEAPMHYTQPKTRSTKKIILLTTIFVVLIIGLLSFVGMAIFGHKYEQTPDIIGKSVKEAEQILNDNHLKLGDISRSYSDKYPENEIIKTSPNKDDRIERGDSVDIVISKGPETVKMPSVVGLSKEEALSKLNDLNLKDVTVEQIYHMNTPKGFIAEQNIEEGAQVNLNQSNIKIYESLGVKQVYVGDYENKSYDAAKKALEAKGFKVNRQERNSDDVKKGNVISQSPKNQSLDEGTTINLTVSQGSEDETKEDNDDDNEDKDKDNSDSDSESNSSDQAVENYTETVNVSYDGENGKAQTVQVYARDKDHSGNQALASYRIKSDKTITIPLKIEKGKTAGYTVRVDGDIVADKDIPYED